MSRVSYCRECPECHKIAVVTRDVYTFFHSDSWLTAVKDNQIEVAQTIRPVLPIPHSHHRRYHCLSCDAWFAVEVKQKGE